MSDCPICDELVWEEEWDIVDDTILHERCRKEFIKRKYRISEEQINILTKHEKITQEFTAIKKEIAYFCDYYTKRIAELENSIGSQKSGKKAEKVYKSRA